MYAKLIHFSAQRAHLSAAISCALALSFAVCVAPGHAVVIALNGVIGPAGTNANTVDAVGAPVNFTGVGGNGVATTLTAAGSGAPAPVSFDFNTGFADTFDRTIGSAAGAGIVFADRKTDSASAFPLILDTNNNGSFGDETDSAPIDPNTFHLGFGMHSDTFITFDLNVIRTNAALPVAQQFTLTGEAGVANPPFAPPLSSGAIILDGVELAVFDWNSTAGGSYDAFDSFNLLVPGTARYLTFIGLSGLDNGNGADHIGFKDVLLTTPPVPEPSTLALLGLGMVGLGVKSSRRRRAAV